MNTKLATTKQGNEFVENPPDANSIKKCFDFPESADYLLLRLIEKLGSVGLLDKAEELVEKVREFVEIVHKQRELRGDPWAADRACERTDFQNLQINLAKEARELVTKSIAEPIKMDFALNDMAQFLRGYSVNGKPLDPELLDSCDKLFNAWLAENNLLSKKGQIYEITDKGEIRKDAKGKLMIAASNRVEALLNDPAKGFQAYLAKATKAKDAIKLTTQKNPYPEEKPEAKPESKVRAAAKKKIRAEEPKVQPKQEKGGVAPDRGTPT